MPTPRAGRGVSAIRYDVVLQDLPMSSPAHQSVVVRDRLTRPHPLVAATQQAAGGAKPDETGRLILGYGGVAKIKVSRSALPRALRLLDALCKGAQARGWDVVAGTRHSGNANMTITQSAFKVEFTVTEETTKQPHVRSKSEEAMAARGRAYGIPQWDYEPTGRLLLRLDHYLAKRSNYSDGVRQRLDDRLDDVLDEVGRIFEAEHQRQVEWEKRERAQAEQRVIAVEAAYQRLVQDRRRECVEAQTVRWRLARDLRTYADEVTERLPQMTADDREGSMAWLTWVKRYLDEQLDPLVRAPGLPVDPDRHDSSIAPLIAGRSGNQGWLDWLSASGSS